MRRFACFTIALLLTAVPASAQFEPIPPVIPPGWVLVDDMILPEDVVYGDGTYTGNLWPAGVVPYAFHANVDTTNQARALDAMAEWAAVAGVTFVLRTSESSYIVFTNSTGNNSYVGRIGGGQTINIYNWTWRFIICHEICHALGTLHEQQRWDRDTYVQINWGNIQSGASGNFTLNPGAATVGAYDFDSLMHYGRTAFSSNGLDTITVLAPNQGWQNLIGQRQHMSILDAQGMAVRYPSPVAPAVTEVIPPAIDGLASPTGPTLTITVNGSRFHAGRLDGGGVAGSRVLWNGMPLSTTYVDPDTLTAQVPPALRVGSGCVDITVENPAPGSGLSLPFGVPLVPSGSGSFEWFGDGDGAQFGQAVAAAGDLDLDGVPDVVVGSPGDGADSGLVRAFSGATGAVLWTRTGVPGERLGQALAAIGDLDGDGRPDVIAGAPKWSSRGRAYVLSGLGGSTLRTWSGTLGGQDLGWSVASAGDLGGDALPDVIVGVPGDLIGRGRVFVYDGSSSAVLRDIAGDAFFDRFGEAVAGGLDLDGDSVPDFAVGAPNDDNGAQDSGMVRAYSGATGLVLATLNGSGVRDHFGASVVLLPSLDGDALADVVAGATQRGQSTSLPSGAGYVRAFSGGTWGQIHAWSGTQPDDLFGTSLARVGDADGDGVDEIAIGAPQTGGVAIVGPGYFQVVSGAGGGLLFDSAGATGGGGFGRAVAGVGDPTGNGLLDVAAGAHLETGLCGVTGRVHLVSVPVSPSGARVMISEVTWIEPDGLEITNHGDQTVDLSDWVVRWKDQVSEVTSAGIGLSLPPGGLAVVTEVGGAPVVPPGTPVAAVLPAVATGTGDFTVALVDGTGVVRDEVRISNWLLQHVAGSFGGRFRGLALRTLGTLGTGSVERISGLDSQAGADWTEQPTPSLGLENISTGLRGTDPEPLAGMLLNEIDPSGAYLELRNPGASARDLRGWRIAVSGAQGQGHLDLWPWPGATPVPAGGYAVVGDGPPPGELPGGVPYADLSGLGGLPLGDDEFSIGLYDAFGRLVDLVRATGHDDLRVHNHPRAPAHWSAFRGAIDRQAGSPVIGRDGTGSDTDTGADWGPLPGRSMGIANGAFTGPAGLQGDLDVRIHGTAAGGGLTLLINAGSGASGHYYSFFLSFQHSHGAGPFLGMAPDAYFNWLELHTVPPFGGFLDAKGSMRVDLPSGIFPPLQIDTLFALVDLGAGTVTGETRVLEFDP